MGRGRYVVRRIFWALITLWVAATINFFLFRLLPGNVVTKLARVPDATPALRAAIAREFGLDQSTWHQYWSYMWQLLHGNLGVSFQNAQPVVDNLRLDLANTIPMVLLGTIISILLGITTGVIAAWRRGTWSEHLSVAPALGFYAMPVQWLGLVLIILFESILPTSGRVDDFLIDPSFAQHQEDVLKHMVLPALTLGLVLYGQYTL